nr:filaggrin-like isoform X1 [Procambarus clarkii]
MAPVSSSSLRILLPVILLLLQGVVTDGREIEKENGSAPGWASSNGPSRPHHPGSSSDPHHGNAPGWASNNEPSRPHHPGNSSDPHHGNEPGWASSNGPSRPHHPGYSSDPHQGSRENAPGSSSNTRRLRSLTYEIFSDPYPESPEEAPFWASSSGPSTSHHRNSSSAAHTGSQGFLKQLTLNYETRSLKSDHWDQSEPLVFKISHRLIHRLSAITDTLICHILHGMHDSHSKTKEHSRSTQRGAGAHHESREHTSHSHTLSCYPAKYSILRLPATDSHHERGQHHSGKHDHAHSRNASSHAKNASFHAENPSHPREYQSTLRPVNVPLQPENKISHQSNVTNHQANSTIRHPVKALVHTKEVTLHRSNATIRLQKASHSRENDTNPHPVKHINVHPENATYPAANNTTPHPASPHRENTTTHRKNLILPVRNATFHGQNFTFPQSKVSNKRGNDTFLVRGPPSGDGGDAPLCDYSKFHSSHSMVLEPNPECEPSRAYISEKEKNWILSLHNTLRAKVAKGDEPRGDPGPQPQAANMAVLSWNDELSEVAQAWANQCTLRYDGFNKRKICSRNYAVGQNVYYHTGHDHPLDWAEAVNGWYEEVVHLSRTHVHVFRPNTFRNTHRYSQLVWAKTREVGCGSATFRDKNSIVRFIYVCNYGPAGNIFGDPVYLEGPPASDCRLGAPSHDYPALCQRDDSEKRKTPSS